MAVRNRLKRICFTLNNYTEEDEQRIQQSVDLYQYAIYGREVAPGTGTRHLQGIDYSRLPRPRFARHFFHCYDGPCNWWGRELAVHYTLTRLTLCSGFINFKSKREFTSIKTVVGNTAHIEPSKGNDEQNKEYCSKENNFWEFGVPCTKGKRTDLERVVSTIRGSANLKSVIEAHPEQYIRYHRGIEKCFGFLAKRTKRDWRTEAIVYCGEAGSGKSRTANEIAKARGYELYYKPRGDWWDGYTGEEAIIIDDFYGWLKFDDVLRICDRYPHQVPVKGGFVEFLGKLVIFTSNRKVRDWWRGEWYNDFTYKALRRRLDIYEWWETIDNVLIRTDLMNIESINDLMN
uniref:Replication-associated protein n=1 Tax=Circoviridae sp. TaxID=1954248 RepID=A0A6M3YNY4_9VIRU|nr:MAG: replication associated protein [Circoviridae sp.]